MKKDISILFLENEFIGRNSSGGVMTYMSNLTSFYQHNGVKYKWLTCADDVNTTPTIIRIAKTPISNVAYVLKLFVWALTNKIDPDTVIHSNRADYLLPFILFQKRIKRVCTVHGMHDVCFSMKKGKVLGFIYDMVYRCCIANTHKVISVDMETTKRYKAKFHLGDSVISTIPIGVDFERFKPMDRIAVKANLGLSQEKKYVLYIGRLEYEKNLGFLLQSFKLLSSSLADVHLLIIGSGSWKARLNEQVNTLAMDNVKFVNEIDYTQVPQWINASELLVLCSLYEGSPTVIREALACDIPVVTLDVGDVRAVLSKIGDQYISENDTKQFAAKMNDMLQMKHPAFRDLIREYSADAMGAKTVEVYKQVNKL